MDYCNALHCMNLFIEEDEFIKNEDEDRVGNVLGSSLVRFS